MGSLGDGLRAIRALALKGHVTLPEHSPLSARLLDELTYEAEKFLIFRSCHIRDREFFSLKRVRSLREILKHAA